MGQSSAEDAVCGHSCLLLAGSSTNAEQRRGRQSLMVSLTRSGRCLAAPTRRTTTGHTDNTVTPADRTSLGQSGDRPRRTHARRVTSRAKSCSVNGQDVPRTEENIVPSPTRQLRRGRADARCLKPDATSLPKPVTESSRTCPVQTADRSRKAEQRSVQLRRCCIMQPADG